jgi:hypothetical protein
LWILSKRPNSITITVSGIEHLIKNGFPGTYIRDIITNYQKYNISATINKHDGFTVLNCNIYEQMINMAWRTYLDKILFDNNLSEYNYKELSYYHRIASNDDISYSLIWSLNGRNKIHVQYIERLIKENVDVKPYEMFKCYTWYETSKPYKFIKDV